MHVLFDDSSQLEISLNQTPAKATLEHMIKHLGNVPLPFRVWDNPFYTKNNDQDQLVHELVKFGKLLDIDVSFDRCLSKDQEYFNQLHEIYEQYYDGNPAWLDYHEHIHLCEPSKKQNSLVLYHRELAGPLIRPMNLSWLESATCRVKPGDVYVAWAELGKTPYQYWKNQEPNDLKRLCSLAKPWVHFYPKIMIALEPQDFLDIEHRNDFELWWQDWSQPWCRHWGIESWSVEDMHAAIVLGRVDLEKLQQLLNQNSLPKYVRLD